MVARPLLSKKFGIDRCEFLGVEHLQRSLAEETGILLAANHSRNADPPVLGALSVAAGQYFYFAASWHLFQKSRFERWRIHRLGAFSVFREGTDREALRHAVDILVAADRPIVLFPEGTFYRQNDRVGPVQDGVAFIARQAAKAGARPIVIHPIAIKYFFLEDPVPAIDRRLARLERVFQWTGRGSLDFAARIARLTEAFLAVKEVEHLGGTSSGRVAQRLVALAETLLDRLDQKYLGHLHSAPLMMRVRSLRPLAARGCRDPNAAAEVKSGCLEDMRELALAQQLFAHLPDYLEEWPNELRIAEALQRLEEDAFDIERPIAPMGAVVEVGAGIRPEDVARSKRTGGDGSDPLTRAVADGIRQQLDHLVDRGPPAAWGRPLPPVQRQRAERPRDVAVEFAAYSTVAAPDPAHSV